MKPDRTYSKIRLNLTSKRLPDSCSSPMKYSSTPLAPAHTGTFADFNKLSLPYPVAAYRELCWLEPHTQDIINAALLEYCRGV